MNICLLLLMALSCAYGGSVSSPQDTWIMGTDGATKIHLGTYENTSAVLDNDGKLLVKLADDEIITDSAFSEDRTTLVLLLYHKRIWNGGAAIGTWYSRIAWIHISQRRNLEARIRLHYDGDFGRTWRLTIYKLLSVAKDGKSIDVRLSVRLNDVEEKGIRTINLFPPSFR